MRDAVWLVLAVAAAACTTESFDYRATVTFPSDLGTVRLNHQAVTSGSVWAASYSSFADALRDPSIVELDGRTLTIGPDACAHACADCQFDRATLAFALAADDMRVTGTCGDGDRVVEIR
jgi:hypothetical protein